MPCDTPLAGVIPAAGGRYVLAGRPAGCGVNLADGAECSARRAGLSRNGIEPPPTEPEGWLRGVQDTRAGALLFAREEHGTFTRELYKQGECSPTHYGPIVRLAQPRRGLGRAAEPSVAPTMRFSGDGVRCSNRQ